ncbi:MAG: transporter family protein [Planctomycetota bacterium]|jgi:hypothetical protein
MIRRSLLVGVVVSFGCAATVAGAGEQERALEFRRLIEGDLAAADAAAAQMHPTLDDERPYVGSVSLAAFQDAEPEEIEAPPGGGGGGGSTGTDPRDFADKFMPYYRYLELDNNLEMHSLTMFGLFAFNPRLAMTYELPVAQKLDVSDVAGFPGPALQNIPGQGQGSTFPSTGLPANLLNTDLDFAGDEVGMGDLILRMFGRPESWEWVYDDGSGNDLGKPKSFALMPTIEFTLPTASEDVLGGEALIVSPALTFVWDLPGDAPFGLGFLAGMNFIDFDAYKDTGRNSTTRYRGRYFWMQPLAPPGPNLFDGLYILTEVQPIYDFMTSDFDLWVGPEFGKIIKEGFIVYGKPGWGIDTEPEDRSFTFEVGMRIFY